MLSLLLALQTGFVFEEVFLEHKTGEGFPERPDRLRAIVKRLEDSGLRAKMVQVKPLADPVDWIAELHSREYIARVKAACATAVEGESILDTRDMPISARSYEAAVTAVGGLLAAVDGVVDGRLKNAYCAVRPPGHHALRDKAMGFCLFNSVAIAARYAQKKHGLKKILIVDWDVHHGNSTQDFFDKDPSVMLFDTHLSPFYPGTGKEAEKGVGNIHNVELKAGDGDEAVLKAYEEKLVPLADAFKPDLVLISCGFDSHKGDLLGRLAITSEGFGKMTRIVKSIAERHAKGRLISSLEGGYLLENLAGASEAHVRALME